MAVVTSLLIAWAGARSNRTKLKAFIDIVVVVGNDIAADHRPRYLSITVVNTGNLPLRLEFGFFAWKAAFDREYASVNPLDYYGIDRFYPKVEYPREIAARASHRICLSDYETFAKEIRTAVKRLKWARRLRFRHQRGFVWTSDGRRFSVQISSSVRRELDHAAAST